MDTNELKFVLKLLGCINYRASLSGSAFKGSKGICQALGDRELVDYSREIASVKILPPGQALLKLDLTQVPIPPKELKVLQKIDQTSGKTAPSKITSLKAAERDTVLQVLNERGLIAIERQIKRTQPQVWLTERGIEFLRDEYTPTGTANISLDLLNNYLRFLRKHLRGNVAVAEVTTAKTTLNFSDEDILQIIQHLDKELGTRNYLPIFHLRQKLQPPLSRDELDQALYRLQKTDKIELSSLLDPTRYTIEEINAGIPQNVGGPLFFIIVNDQ